VSPAAIVTLSPLLNVTSKAWSSTWSTCTVKLPAVASLTSPSAVIDTVTSFVVSVITILASVESTIKFSNRGAVVSPEFATATAEDTATVTVSPSFQTSSPCAASA